MGLNPEGRAVLNTFLINTTEKSALNLVKSDHSSDELSYFTPFSVFVLARLDIKTQHFLIYYFHSIFVASNDINNLNFFFLTLGRRLACKTACR